MRVPKGWHLPFGTASHLPDRQLSITALCVSNCVFVRSVAMAVTSQSGTYGSIPDTLLYTLRFVADFAWGSEEPAFRGMVNLSRAGKLVLEPRWKPGGCCRVQLCGRG